MSISSTIKSIQDIMRKDVGVDGDAQRIGQLVWMLFLKILTTASRSGTFSKTTTNLRFQSNCVGATGPPTQKA